MPLRPNGGLELRELRELGGLAVAAAEPGLLVEPKKVEKMVEKTAEK